MRFSFWLPWRNCSKARLLWDCPSVLPWRNYSKARLLWDCPSVLPWRNYIETRLPWDYPSVLPWRNYNKTRLLWDCPVLPWRNYIETSLPWDFPSSHNSFNAVLACNMCVNEITDCCISYTKLVQGLQTESTVMSFPVSSPEWIIKKKSFMWLPCQKPGNNGSVLEMVGRPDVSIHVPCWLERSLMDSFFLSVSASKAVAADPLLSCTMTLLEPRKEAFPYLWLSLSLFSSQGRLLPLWHPRWTWFHCCLTACVAL